MFNRVKIVAAVAAVIAGMVIYKGWFDRRQEAADEASKKRAKEAKQRWN